MTIAVMNAMIRPLIEAELPDWIEPLWFTTSAELFAMAPRAEIGWFDTYDMPATFKAARRAKNLRWLNTLAAGVENFPLAQLKQQGAALTNGAGINAIAIAEYAVMGMLNVAKGTRDVLRAADRQEWLTASPGVMELAGSKALILGAGAIGHEITKRLHGFDVEICSVRRRPDAGQLGPDDWRVRLGEFDWIILTVPATPETEGMIGAAELAAMKPSATLMNFARGTVIDQNALVAALQKRAIGHAFLDVTEPEPLPADHPLWRMDNATITMHLSGRSQMMMFRRSATRFIANLAHWQRGETLDYLVDLDAGY
ncbi:MAG: hypothetical protein RLY97_1218 [Pseudomonadota bacterium]|jgi:phosphoglycerate dehydrogenase-like enzyme